MKNVMAYIHPEKRFVGEPETLVKLQIDNSLSLGWKPEDIILATNFPYEYRGVKAVNIGDAYCDYHLPGTKIFSIVRLFELGLIEDDLYWYHDFDCYQLTPDIDPDLGTCDVGLTNYNAVARMCSASIFFKKSAKDVFETIKAWMDDAHKNEENRFLRYMKFDQGKRVKHLNITYGYNKFNLRVSFKKSHHPIKIVHFHPAQDKLDFFVRRKNHLKIVLLPKDFIDLLAQYGYA